MTPPKSPDTIDDLLGPDAPKNWGKWGPDDEVGSLNYLTAEQVLRGIQAVKTGELFTLQTPIGSPRTKSDPVWPDRGSAVRTSIMDNGFFERGDVAPPVDGHRYADDTIDMYLQGSTQYDALGHVWYGDQIWNGYPADTTTGSLSKASVFPIADRGVAGHGILIDMARHRGVPFLGPGEGFELEELLAAAASQGTTISPRDVLLVRTGWTKRFYDIGPAAFYEDFREPGLIYSPELVTWFQQMEIPNLVTDLIGNESTYYKETGIEVPLHSALMRNLGVAFTEICDLERLADACSEDRRWTFLYTAAPLKVVGASGAPVNPVVIR